MKNYRYFGDEMEVLGNRLDHARDRLANSKSKFTDRAYQKLFKHDADLDASWHAHREQRLARAQ